MKTLIILITEFLLYTVINANTMDSEYLRIRNILIKEMDCKLLDSTDFKRLRNSREQEFSRIESQIESLKYSIHEPLKELLRNSQVLVQRNFSIDSILVIPMMQFDTSDLRSIPDSISLYSRIKPLKKIELNSYIEIFNNNKDSVVILTVFSTDGTSLRRLFIENNCGFVYNNYFISNVGVFPVTSVDFDSVFYVNQVNDYLGVEFCQPRTEELILLDKRIINNRSFKFDARLLKFKYKEHRFFDLYDIENMRAK